MVGEVWELRMLICTGEVTDWLDTSSWKEGGGGKGGDGGGF